MACVKLPKPFLRVVKFPNLPINCAKSCFAAKRKNVFHYSCIKCNEVHRICFLQFEKMSANVHIKNLHLERKHCLQIIFYAPTNTFVKFQDHPIDEIFAYLLFSKVQISQNAALAPPTCSFMNLFKHKPWS